MKLRELTIAMVVLAALMGVLYWSNHHKTKEDESVKASADAAPKILSLNQADIVAVRIDRKDQPELRLTRNPSGQWEIDAPKTLPADQESVASLLSTLSSLNSDRLLEEKPGDLAGYGLAAPALSVDISLKDNQTQKLLVGDATPAGNSFYAMLAGDPRLFTLAGYSKNSFDKTANDFRDKRLLTEDFDRVSQIELINQKPDKKQDITFAREKDAWQILKPKPYRADSFQVEDVIRALRGAKFETGAPEQNGQLESEFKSATPLATVKIAGAAGTQQLELRKEKNDYLAKSSVVPGIYKVTASLESSLDKTLDDFRNKKLFEFSYSEPNKIEIHDAAKSYFFTRSGTDWWGPDGKKVDPNNVEDLISKLREFSADSFPDTGFSNAILEIVVTSEDGKRVEKIALAKSGETYLAKRENEPTIYGLSSASVNEIGKAASDVKPATQSKTK